MSPIVFDCRCVPDEACYAILILERHNGQGDVEFLQDDVGRSEECEIRALDIHAGNDGRREELVVRLAARQLALLSIAAIHFLIPRFLPLSEE